MFIMTVYESTVLQSKRAKFWLFYILDNNFLPVVPESKLIGYM